MGSFGFDNDSLDLMQTRFRNFQHHRKNYVHDNAVRARSKIFDPERIRQKMLQARSTKRTAQPKERFNEEVKEET